MFFGPVYSFNNLVAHLHDYCPEHHLKWPPSPNCYSSPHTHHHTDSRNVHILFFLPQTHTHTHPGVGWERDDGEMKNGKERNREEMGVGTDRKGGRQRSNQIGEDMDQAVMT